jgi:hypothetical protein
MNNMVMDGSSLTPASDCIFTASPSKMVRGRFPLGFAPLAGDRLGG